VRRLSVEPVAEAEIFEAFEWYRARSTIVARAFGDTLDATLVTVGENPEQFPVVHREIRRALLPNFPYAAFFVVDLELIRVVGVLHGKRHPRRWQHRR
jgi:plasmid stabilization system protein ParE